LNNSYLTVAAAAAALLICGARNAQAADADSDSGLAAQYCVQSGGVVLNRFPYYGTNGPFTSWLQLLGEKKFCQFTSATDGSRIHITLETLYATRPSLAALAYYNKPPLGSGGPGNPASYYCTQLGGSDLFGGVSAAGGGWVNKDSIDQVLEACIFPDMSSIDSWGLTYNTEGIIRGIDLTTVLRYQPSPATSAPPAP
jgi:putative hemolysin